MTLGVGGVDAMVDKLSVLFMYWIIYSLLGWIVETIYCSVLDGYFVERGFLNGPLCPIYGFGALFVLLLLNQYSDNVVIVFIFGMIYTTIIEYITSFIMEKLFKMRWWDYSDYKFNIRGRVCLRNSFLFGFLCVVLIEIIHPFTENIMTRIPITIIYLLSICILISVLVDLFISINSIVNLNRKLEEIHYVKEEIWIKLYEEGIVRKLENLRVITDSKLNDLKELKENLTEFKENISIDKVEISLRKKYKSLLMETKYVERRLICAFPKLKSQRYNEALHELRKAIKDIENEDYFKKILKFIKKIFKRSNNF